MRIHPAELDDAAGAVTVRYRFEPATAAAGELFFRVPAEWREWIHSGPEPAAAALSFLAMALGEDVELTAPVSPQFQYGFHRAVEHFHLWWPQFPAVRLHAPGFEAAPAASGAVLSCFSGGVDSFHTLYAHLDGTAPPFRPTHLLFARGFDIPLADPRYDELAREFAGLAADLGLRLVPLATNARQFLDPHAQWQYTHGTCLTAAGLLLSRGAQRLIIPSTNRQSTLFLPCGSNPITDPMLRTEAIDIVHYGTHLSRIGKILAIAERPEAQRHLRVCWQNVPGQRNCGTCTKCLNTMMPLALVGVLERFTVFPPLPPWRAIDRRCFAPFDASALSPEVSYAEELRRLAAARGVRDFPSWRVLELAARVRVKTLLRRLLGVRGRGPRQGPAPPSPVVEPTPR